MENQGVLICFLHAMSILFVLIDRRRDYSPDYGKGRSPPNYRDNRKSPEYRGRRSPDYGGGRSPDYGRKGSPPRSDDRPHRSRSRERY